MTNESLTYIIIVITIVLPCKVCIKFKLLTPYLISFPLRARRIILSHNDLCICFSQSVIKWMANFTNGGTAALTMVK